MPGDIQQQLDRSIILLAIQNHFLKKRGNEIFRSDFLLNDENGQLEEAELFVRVNSNSTNIFYEGKQGTLVSYDNLGLFETVRLALENWGLANPQLSNEIRHAGKVNNYFLFNKGLLKDLENEVKNNLKYQKSLNLEKFERKYTDSMNAINEANENIIPSVAASPNLSPQGSNVPSPRTSPVTVKRGKVTSGELSNSYE